MWLSALMVIIVLLVNTLAYGEKKEGFEDLIDYEELDHQLVLSKLRAGNHDVSGVNDYYFNLQLYALAILKEERKKDFSERLKIQRDMGPFGDIQVKTLSYWQGDDSSVMSRIQGEDVRDLMSEAMRTFNTTENQVAVLVKVVLFEKNKQFIFFGEDRMIGQSSYYIIPESIPHKPKLENKSIEITDELGTLVLLDIQYDALNPKRKKKK